MHNLSKIGRQLTSDAGIVDLMEDLGQALNVDPELLFLGGGNPAAIPEFEAVVARVLSDIAADPDALHRLLGVYQSPRGSEELLLLLCDYLRCRYQWPLSEQNLCLTNGSQSAFFMLINMLAGPSGASGVHKQICFPIMPDYLGYADQGLHANLFYGFQPKIELIEDHQFKYHIDFDSLVIKENTAALCLSRPTNPSGNVVADADIVRLANLARERGIYLIIDCAYGEPFPGVIYREAAMPWHESIIYVMSLSKMGLPGVRTGIVVGPEKISRGLLMANTVTSLACGNLGPQLMSQLLKEDLLDHVCRDIIYPFYRQRRDTALRLLAQYFYDIPYRVHCAEGAFFLWVWLQDLPITSGEVYARLKEKGVLIMDGSFFFFALENYWPHAGQCIRLTYCLNDAKLEQALAIIGDQLRTIYHSE